MQGYPAADIRQTVMSEGVSYEPRTHRPRFGLAGAPSLGARIDGAADVVKCGESANFLKFFRGRGRGRRTFSVHVLPPG